MGNKDQTKWIESYSVKYSHDETLVDGSTEMQVFCNNFTASLGTETNSKAIDSIIRGKTNQVKL